MSAFEPIRSGIPSLDTVLDSIRLGDNVVLQVGSIEEFQYFIDPFVKQVKADGRRLVYLRFAKHAPLASEEDAVRYTLDPSDGFEQFTIRVHEIITQEGRETCYIFDCLSDLQVAWAADLMMGNFFNVTCPYLFQLDTVALFPVLRGDHAFEALARIQETTQLFLDVYSDTDSIYVHPVKVWNRYSATMFLPHRAKRADGVFRTLTDSVSSSRYYAVVSGCLSAIDQNLDSWERYFLRCRMEGEDAHTGTVCFNLCRMMMTRDRHIRELFRRNFTLEDYFAVKDRMIGSGKIGGKSCGMLLARSIVKHRLPHLAQRMEPHDSFFVGDHVFYTYLVYNHLWQLHVAQKSESGYYSLASQLADGIRNGSFPENIRAELRRMLSYYGQSPIIVRSSSMQEDGFGNAFAGKYESVFCANQGSDEERLCALESAMKTVYASTVNPSALEYRAARGLQVQEEQMPLLIQRVSGSLHGRYFFPSAAGVGYSYDNYGLSQNLDPKKGMLRMVLGLGTRAVDRTDNDYPRIIHLDKPQLGSYSTMDERVRYSQKKVDVIDLSENRVGEIDLEELMRSTPFWYQNLVLEHDTQVEQRLRERGENRFICFGTCGGYVRDRQYLQDMEDILAALHSEYDNPVDVEFTVNSNEDKEYVICLLQCRPLQIYQGGKAIVLPDIPPESLLFRTENCSMGPPQSKMLDAVVAVDARGYYQLSYNRKGDVANLITAINTQFRGTGKQVLLLVPGRIGTSSPELGIPVRFAGISQFSAIVEMDDQDSGYMPELSFGSHMFQDLVEAKIFYSALFRNNDRETARRGTLLSARCSRLPLPTVSASLEGIVSVYDTSSSGLTLCYDMTSGVTLCGFLPAQS